MKNRIFLAAPISGFATEADYLEYRKEVLALIAFLRRNGFEVQSELETVTGAENYDTPAQAVEHDFRMVRENDCFLLLHPVKLQTSALMELGYACALDKRIIAVGKKSDLPYLMLGYADYSPRARIVETERLSERVFGGILQALRAL